MFKALISTALVVMNILTTPFGKDNLTANFVHKPHDYVKNIQVVKNSDIFKSNKNTINLLIGEKAFESTFKQKPDGLIDEDLRIKTHLKYVENYLRHKEISNLNPKLISKRISILNLLKQYISIGKFPRNYDYPGQRKPTFLDKNGNICAVGYLVLKTEGMNLVKEINNQYKYSYIVDMKNNKLNNWVSNSGLSLEEFQMIQPTYCGEPFHEECNPTKDILIISGVIVGILVLSIGSVVLLGNVVGLSNNSQDKIDETETSNLKLTNEKKELSFLGNLNFDKNGISYSLVKF